jgi:hypothetical protein
MRQVLAAAVVAVGLLAAGEARAVDQALVKQAMDRGVQYLRSIQTPQGSWPHTHIGATALGGLTLLECGAPTSDKAVQAAAKAIRDASPNMSHTYSVALSIVFLDRLGDPGDVPLIESLTVRLLAGQTATGGWNYDCPTLDAKEAQRLADVAKRQNELVGRREPPKGPAGKRTVKDVSPEVQAQLAQLTRAVPLNKMSDNSNTQFATLALWVGRRHGLPVDSALARVDARFRTSQNADGGWSYTDLGGGGIPGNSLATMTCAGVMALAVAAGSGGDVAKDQGKTPRDLNKDIHLRAGLQALSTVVGEPVGNRKRAVVLPARGRAFYFLWSLERASMALNLETIGKKDWYSWGAEILLVSQQRNGAWVGDYGEGGVDTCFALLFLARSNLARDLSAKLRDRFKDPGVKVLRSGGVGGVGLKPGGPTPGLDSPITSDARPDAKAPAAAKVSPGDRPLLRERTDPLPATRPPAAVAEDTPAARLGGDLVRARGARQNQMLQSLKDGKGVLFTEALVSAIPRLEGEARRKAREALAERVTRMSDKTLGSYLQDEDPELRRAAALACAMKESKERVPDLVRLLSDPEPLVERAAHAALKELTGQDLGPPAGADRTERARAIAAWKVWWNKQSRR